MANVSEIWTDSIDTAGISRRVNFRAKLIDELGAITWHYFGTTEGDIPAPNGETVVEHNFVQFPADFSELGEDENATLYELGLRAGLRREGLE